MRAARPRCRARPPEKPTLNLEQLEPRIMLSGEAGLEFQINTFTTSDQWEPSVATMLIYTVAAA